MNSMSLRFALIGVISIITQSAIATNIPKSTNSTLSIPLSLLNYSGGNDWMRYEIAPNWSRELGWSLKGALGSYITNDLAMGVMVEHGQDKREYLTNAGVRLADKLSFIGTVGILEEHREFVADAGKETVRQMEYGASLKSAYNLWILRGFELNGYLADANANSDNIETGKLFGTQILTVLNLTDSTRIRFGGGYEWLHWDEGEDHNAILFRADGIQSITNNLNAFANVKFGASEYVYGGGLNYNLGDRSNTNTVGINYEQIEGKNGIQSDQRVQLTWVMGLGIGPHSQASSNRITVGGKSNSLNFNQTRASENTLLADVMKRPEFLPQRVLARAKQGSLACTVIPNPTFEFGNSYPDYDWINIARSWFSAEQLVQIDSITASDVSVYYGSDPNNLTLYNPLYSPQLIYQADDWWGTKLYIQFSNTDGSQSQDVFSSGDFVKIRLSVPGGCIELTDQYVE